MVMDPVLAKGGGGDLGQAGVLWGQQWLGGLGLARPGCIELNLGWSWVGGGGA